MEKIFSFAQAERAGRFILLCIPTKLRKAIFLHQRTYIYLGGPYRKDKGTDNSRSNKVVYLTTVYNQSATLREPPPLQPAINPHEGASHRGGRVFEAIQISKFLEKRPLALLCAREKLIRYTCWYISNLLYGSRSLSVR